MTEVEASGEDNTWADSMIPKRVIARVFAVFASDYGHLWISLAKDKKAYLATMKRWAWVLRNERCSQEMIAYAMERLPVEYKDNLPKLGQFVGLCKAYRAPLKFASLPAPVFKTDEQKLTNMDGLCDMQMRIVGRFAKRGDCEICVKADALRVKLQEKAKQEAMG